MGKKIRVRVLIGVIFLVCAGVILAYNLLGSPNFPGIEVTLADPMYEKQPFIDYDEEPYVVAIENVSLRSEYPDTAAVEERINAITIPAINCKVKIVNYHIADHATKVMLSVAGGEKLDIINTGLTTSLSAFVADGVVQPLDQLLAERGQRLLGKAGDLLKATSVNGRIYAVGSNLYPSKANGIGYNLEMAQRYGLEVPQRMTLQTLTEFGYKLKQANPELYLATIGDGYLTIFDVFYFCEAFGGDLNYGVIFDPLNNTRIVNVYESEAYANYCRTMKVWNDNGLIPKDSLTNGQNGQNAFNAGGFFFQQMNISPHGEQIAIKKGLDFTEKLVATTPNVLSTSSIQEYAWGISSVSERPDKAMDFLNLLYDNAELANLLNNGIEGMHYEKVSENIIRYPAGVDGDDVGYGRIFSMYGDTRQVYQFEPATESFYDDLQTFTQEAKPIKTLGYAFDTKPVATEIAAVNSIVQEFRPFIECGVAQDVESALQDFNTALKLAGIDKVIAENQRQLDIWLEMEAISGK